MLRFFGLVLVVSVVVVSCDLMEPTVVVDGQHTTVVQPIVNGTRDPETVALSPDEIMAIGYLATVGDPTTIFCTATLVAPDLVVTAAHCTYGAVGGEIGFGVGVDPGDFDAFFVADAIYVSREVDAAILHFDTPITDSQDVDITPIPINSAPRGDDDIGRPVQAGGYGETYNEETDGRWFATVYIYDIDREMITVDGRGVQGICFGDSGSGLIDIDEDGNPVVLAVESGGDATCVDIDRLTRLDTIYDDWVQPILDGNPPPDPCEGIPREGRCVDDIAESCRRSGYRQTDCAEHGTTCEYIAEAERYDCVCLDDMGDGWCNGDQVETCREGRLRSFSCSMMGGGTCGWDPYEYEYTCVPIGTACRAEDAAGRCQGDTAISCADGITTREVCNAGGGACVETDTGAECAGPDTADEAGDSDEADGGVFPDLDEADTGVDDAKRVQESDDCGSCAAAHGRSFGRFEYLGFILGILFGWRRRRCA